MDARDREKKCKSNGDGKEKKNRRERSNDIEFVRWFGIDRPCQWLNTFPLFSNSSLPTRVPPGELDVSEASDLFERYSEGALLASADECLTPGEEGAAKLIKRFRQLRLPLSRRESFV